MKNILLLALSIIGILAVAVPVVAVTVSPPTNVYNIPAASSISLVWTKGADSTSTLVRYSTTSYPATTATGTSGYFGTGSSTKITGLSSGTTYFISMWGYAGGVYSDNYTTTVATTLAYDTTGSTNDIETSNTTLTDNISSAKVVLLPWAQAFEDISDANGMPVLSIWYIFWFMLGVGGGIILYNRMPGQYNINVTVIVEALWFGFGVTMGLLYLLIPFILVLVAAGFIIFGQRH